MIDALYNVPSIAVWVPFNEGWGQFDAAEIAEWTKSYDPTRVVDHASGWFDQGAGDLKDEHIYMRELTLPEPESERALVLGEFGGLGLLNRDHCWQMDDLFVPIEPDAYVFGLTVLENALYGKVAEGAGTRVSDGAYRNPRRSSRLKISKVSSPHSETTTRSILVPPWR